jgi:hypothetical protein
MVIEDLPACYRKRFRTNCSSRTICTYEAKQKMTTRNLNLERVGDVRLRDDGERVIFDFVGKEGKTFVITLTFEQLQLVEQKIIDSAYAARFSRGLHSDTPTAFSPLPDVVLVDNLQLELAPSGQLNFRIGSHDGRSIHVTFRADHSQMIRQILGGTGEQFRTG